MVQVQNTLVSLDLLEKKFVCDLQQCKGACCVEGDAGAPLLKEELPIIDAIYDKVKPYMREPGVKAIAHQGKYTLDEEDEYVTTLVDKETLPDGKKIKGACAYVVFEKNGTTKCAFEQAFVAGKTTFKKPISCHLYPVRIAKYNEFEAVNFHEWSICKSACACGKKLDVKVYQFVKEALIRKYGEQWFEELEMADSVFVRPKG